VGAFLVHSIKEREENHPGNSRLCMFKEPVTLMRMKAKPHPELRDLIAAELPGGGEYVKIKSASFLFCYPSPNLMFLLHI